MKAVEWTAYGGPEVLNTNIVDIPAVNDNEVLVNIAYSSVSKGDCETRQLDLPFTIRNMMRMFFGIKRPKRVKIPGQELSGIIVKTGANIEDYKEGDKVFGSPGIMMGAYAEYISMATEKGSGALGIVPDGMKMSAAAVLTTGGMESLHFFDKSDIKKGEKVLINGAGGSIGTMFLQLAKSEGAVVTAVDREEKLDFLKTLGADKTINYLKVDFAEENEKYDIVFDVVGKGSYRRSLKVLDKGGRYLLANPTFPKIAASMFVNLSSSKKVVVGGGDYTKFKLERLASMVIKRDIKIPIDREYSLDEIRMAHEYVDSGMKMGNVVIAIEKSPQ